MDSFIEEENGQSLVIVLLMIVIAVIIAIAISFRTIQDIRRAGEEKASSRAGNQAESVLEVISSPGVINNVVEECSNSQWSLGNNICEFSKNELQQNYLTDAVSIEVCDELDLLLKREDGINNVLVRQDDVFEVDLRQVNSDDSFSISWNGDASNLIVKVYKKNCVESGADDRNSMDCTDETAWLSTAGTPTNINFSSEAYIVRIKPIGGDASITINNLPGDVVYIVSAKAKCYTKGADGGDIYREFVRRIRLNPTLPACFDYVLFSGDGEVKKGV
jgi:uncharacterized protein (UPF0333 family)